MHGSIPLPSPTLSTRYGVGDADSAKQAAAGRCRKLNATLPEPFVDSLPQPVPEGGAIRKEIGRAKVRFGDTIDFVADNMFSEQNQGLGTFVVLVTRGRGCGR
jgi:hypothetical protein